MNQRSRIGAVEVKGDVLFISDVHLGASSEVDVRFEKFVRRLPESVTVVFLGDLVNAWAEGRNYDFAGHYPSLKLLRGKRCLFQRGNRDFLMGARWIDSFGGSIIDDVAAVNVRGEKILCTHGDLLMSRDLRYRIWRMVCRSSLFSLAARNLSKTSAERLVGGLRRESEREVARKSARALTLDLEAAARYIGDANVLVCGHAHSPGVHTIGKRKAYVLGSWDANAEVLFLHGGKTTFASADKIDFS